MSDKNDRARAALAPLRERERPPALLISIVLALAVAGAVVAGVLTSTDLSRRGGSVPGGLFLATVLVVLAANMWRRRYWAVLSFEGLLAFQVLIACLALVLAHTLIAAAGCLAAVALGGLLFYKLVRVMARIQAGERAGGNERAASRLR
jgi:peptidoglycan/LPS O-acetylase OafA/YrhL